MTAKQFQTWRRRRGLCQEQMAQILSVTQSAISQWEQGRTPLPHWVPVLLDQAKIPKEKK